MGEILDLNLVLGVSAEFLSDCRRRTDLKPIIFLFPRRAKLDEVEEEFPQDIS